MQIDFSDATAALLPLFQAVIPYAIAWGIGTKALKVAIDVICGKDLSL